MNAFKRFFSGPLTWNLTLAVVAVAALLIGGVYTFVAGGLLIKMTTAIAAVVTLMICVRLVTFIAALSIKYEAVLDRIKEQALPSAIFFGSLFICLGLIVGSAFGQPPSPAAWPEIEVSQSRNNYADPMHHPMQLAGGDAWPARFDACDPYRDAIEDAVELYWGAFQYPDAWAAQLYQESLCDPWARSPVGAAGLAQFMPATWTETAAALRLQATPHDEIAIEAGAYYMMRQMAVWRSPRPDLERWRLGLASYNAGAGNIIRAQGKCGGARDWREVSVCLPTVTGHHSAETITYVRRTERWWRELASGSPRAAPAEILEGSG
ncbi:transglycosylase SLT domain-containing protein [Maricaulis maris]|uniref:transglycosylase SLT domain-containing protein n=1 Tax=Maricaulis maris TaxID=74318 RepID=UPI003B8D09AC